MVFPILLALLAGQEVTQGDLSRVQGSVDRLASELQRTQALVQSELRPMCSAESRLQAGDLRITALDMPVRVNLLGMVSSPSETCLPAEIRITATYLDAAGGFICSGTTAIAQVTSVQNTFFEFRPYELEVFIRWWDGPTLRQLPLICRDYQSNELRNPEDRAAALRVWATIAPKRGGLSTAEFQLTLPRLQRR